MKRFIQGAYRGQSTLLPESLDDYVNDTNPVRVHHVKHSLSPNWEGSSQKRMAILRGTY